MNEKLKQTLTSTYSGLAHFHLKLNDNTILHVHSVLKSTLCELRDLSSRFEKTLAESAWDIPYLKIEKFPYFVIKSLNQIFYVINFE